jgi:hypothetical protein
LVLLKRSDRETDLIEMEISTDRLGFESVKCSSGSIGRTNERV